MPRVECCHPSCHCSFESKNFMLQHYRDRHSLSVSQPTPTTHTLSRVECYHPSCHRSFETKNSMLQHYRDLHSQARHDQNKLPCLHCSPSFTTKGGLEEHLHVAHRLNQLDVSAGAADTDHVAPALRLQDLQVIDGVACNDCGKLFRSTDFLHQHQWDSANHTRVSKSPIPNRDSCMRACSQCNAKFHSADDLEQHFMDKHPISEVSKCSEEGTWQHVAERFVSAWTNPVVQLYEVHRIFKVYNTGWRRKHFEQYRKELKKEMANQKLVKEDNLELRNKVLLDGNELRRYHGTTVKCRLGRPTDIDIDGTDTQMTTASLCASVDCSLCRILQTGFKKSKCKEEKFQRFGKGIYSSSISSKASAYVKCSSVKENYKVMIACKVLAGRPHHFTCNSQQLQGPPMGFHSVQGDPGVALKYDELVVYDDRAILPAFIILYSSSETA